MQCIWNFIWSEKRFFESIDVSGKCVDISKREKNPFNFATRFVCKECVISFTGSIMCLCKKLRLWKDSFKLWTLLQEDICLCNAWSKLAKKLRNVFDDLVFPGLHVSVGSAEGCDSDRNLMTGTLPLISTPLYPPSPFITQTPSPQIHLTRAAN